MIPLFKDKNRIEKMSLITLTDGSVNSSFNDKMMDTDPRNKTQFLKVTIIQLSKLVKNNTQLKKKDHYYRSYMLILVYY